MTAVWIPWFCDRRSIGHQIIFEKNILMGSSHTKKERERDLLLVFRMAQREGNVRKPDARLSSRGIVCQLQCQMLQSVIFVFTKTSTKCTEKSNGDAATVKLFVIFFLFYFVPYSIFFWKISLSFIYVRLSVHGFQTNDSMPAPEIRVMRTTWLMRRKDHPGACWSDVSPKRFFLDEIKNGATDGHVLYYIILGLVIWNVKMKMSCVGEILNPLLIDFSLCRVIFIIYARLKWLRSLRKIIASEEYTWNRQVYVCRSSRIIHKGNKFTPDIRGINSRYNDYKDPREAGS